jgi:trigger factor
MEACVKKISVEVPLDRVNEEKSALLSEIAKSAQIPGFRKGKVPRSVLEKRYGKSLLTDAAQKLIDSAYREAVESNDLRPIGEPTVDNLVIEEDQPLSFTATVETLPVVELKEFDGYKFTKKINKINDDEISKILDNIQQRHARFEPVEDRPAQENDYVTVDYTAEKDGKEIEPLKGEAREIHLTKGDMLEAVFNNVVGMNKGEEKTFEAPLPKEFPDPELAETNVTFNVKVGEVKLKILPELNDDFAKEASEFDTLAELEADLKDNIEKRNSSMADGQLRDDILGKLIEENSFDLPPRMVDSQADMIAQRTERRLASQGIDMEQSHMDHAQFRDKYLEDAVREIKEQIILSAYAKTAEIDVSQEEFEAEIEKMSTMFGQSVEQTRQQLGQSGGLEGLHHKLFTDKTYEAIIEKVEVEETYVEEENEQ